MVQRPQHLMSRLAGRWRVLFIEEPVPCEGPAFLQVHEPIVGLSVLTPHTPSAASGFHDDQIAHIEPLLTGHLRQQALQVEVAWLYTPMALPLVHALHASCLVYDCMDELAAFKDAPRQLRQRETALLRRAEVVFANGPSLFQAKRALHPRVHCLPDSVDTHHFALSRPLACSVVDRLSWPVAPRLGYFGVIDERLDTRLIAALADAHPDWQIMMAGPRVNIDAHALPQRTNLYWLDTPSYAELPALIASWDLCLVPFALSEATRHIHPVMVLEAMAASKPVVSTPIDDVISLYGHAVDVVCGVGAFVRSCETVLTENATQRGQRALNMLTTVFMHSWDRSADSVHEILCDSLAQATPDIAPDPRLLRVASGQWRA